MKPKAPKKKDSKPKCKTGKVKEGIDYPNWLIGYLQDSYIDEFGNWIVSVKTYYKKRD